MARTERHTPKKTLRVSQAGPGQARPEGKSQALGVASKRQMANGVRHAACGMWHIPAKAVKSINLLI